MAFSLCDLSAAKKKKEEKEKHGQRRKGEKSARVVEGKEKCKEVRESEKAGGAVGRRENKQQRSLFFLRCLLEREMSWSRVVAAVERAEAFRRFDAWKLPGAGIVSRATQ